MKDMLKTRQSRNEIVDNIILNERLFLFMLCFMSLPLLLVFFEGNPVGFPFCPPSRCAVKNKVLKSAEGPRAASLALRGGPTSKNFENYPLGGGKGRKEELCREKGGGKGGTYPSSFDLGEELFFFKQDEHNP